MGESRGAKYGRFLGLFIYNYIQTAIPQIQQINYKTFLIQELKNYSFEPRKKGFPKNSGCVWELEDLPTLNLQYPENLAKLIKEGIHLMYQKQTQKRVLDVLLNELSQPK